MTRLSYVVSVVMFTAVFAAGGCNPGLRVGEVRGGLTAVVASNAIEASPVGCPTKGGARIVVTNNGAQPSTLAAPALSAELLPDPSPSQVGVCALGTILGPSQTCYVSVTANPAVEGDRTELVVVVGTPGGAAEQSLTVTGLPNLSATPTSLAFASTPDAGQMSMTVRVEVGTMPAALAPRFIGFAGGAAEFNFKSFSNQPPVMACMPYDVTVYFTPFASAETYTATLLLDGNADGGISPAIPVTAEVR